MANVHQVRDTALVKIFTYDLAADDGVWSDLIDFKEMNSGTIQIVVDGATANDGQFVLYQSILCNASSFALYPNGCLLMSPTCPNLAANICCIPFRYMRLKYVKGTDTTGFATVYARAKK